MLQSLLKAKTTHLRIIGRLKCAEAQVGVTPNAVSIPGDFMRAIARDSEEGGGGAALPPGCTGTLRSGHAMIFDGRPHCSWFVRRASMTTVVALDSDEIFCVCLGDGLSAECAARDSALSGISCGGRREAPVGMPLTTPPSFLPPISVILPPRGTGENI